MIYILSWTTKKHQKTLSRPLHSKLKQIQGLYNDSHRNLRTFQGKMEFKTSPKNPGLFKTVRTLSWAREHKKLLAQQENQLVLDDRTRLFSSPTDYIILLDLFYLSVTVKNCSQKFAYTEM